MHCFVHSEDPEQFDLLGLKICLFVVGGGGGIPVILRCSEDGKVEVSSIPTTHISETSAVTKVTEIRDIPYNIYLMFPYSPPIPLNLIGILNRCLICLS